jgi:hypothetical protein
MPNVVLQILDMMNDYVDNDLICSRDLDDVVCVCLYWWFHFDGRTMQLLKGTRAHFTSFVKHFYLLYRVEFLLGFCSSCKIFDRKYDYSHSC